MPAHSVAGVTTKERQRARGSSRLATASNTRSTAVIVGRRVALRARSQEFQELEIIVLRHELAILRRTTRRPAITAVDRLLLARSSPILPVKA